MADRVGQQLGNYRLVRLLGTGGFAEVYLGEHIHLGTQAAIKVLSARLSMEEIDHFREEARTIARMKHPFIVRVLEFGVEGDVPYLVMEYAPQGTLRLRHPKGTRLAPEVILPYVQQVAAALEYAHERKVVHRDVKPENMLVGESGEVLLSDFGIAIVAQSSRYQATQDVVGTFAYMAPEQIQAHPRPASDQYALGIVVYEWLSGERPFQGSMSEILAKQITAPPPPLREKLPALSPMVQEVVFTALAKDPKDRFASVRDFATAFEQASRGGLWRPTRSGQLSSGSLTTAPSPIGSSKQNDSSTLFANAQFTPHPPAGQPEMQPWSLAPIEPTIRAEASSGGLTPSQPLSEFEMAPLRSSMERSAATKRVGTPRAPAAPFVEQPPTGSFSRRQIVAGLAGLAIATVAGAGVTWAALSRQQPAALAPTPTNTPAPSTAIQTQPPTPIPTQPPTATPTQPPTATPTPTSPPTVFGTGTWQGQGTYNSGASGFDMLLTITAVNGNTFMGTLQEQVYSSVVAIRGTITGSSYTGVNITFTDYATISGGNIDLNTLYTATVSHGQMNGFWSFQGDISPDGTFTLQQTS